MKIFFKFSILILFISYTSANISEICEKDNDCIANNYCFKGRCHHKSLTPLGINDVIGFIAIIFGSALSNAGGIGGGGLFIPILIMVLEFYTHEAIPISKLMILIGAATAFILNLSMKHPTRHTNSIDYNICILIIPMMLYGTVVGVTLNKVAPSFLILILLTGVLVINSYKTIKRAYNIFHSESEEKLLKEERKDSNINMNMNIKSRMNIMNEDANNSRSSIELQPIRNIKPSLNSQLVRIELEKDKLVFRWEKLKYMVYSYTAIILMSLMKGSDHFDSIIGIKRCSAGYWVIYISYIPIGAFITYLAAKKIEEEMKYRVDIGFPYDNHDIMWNRSLLMRYPIYGFISGLVAGVVGIGGGLIIGPLLIELGINPIISTSTSNFLVLFTSSSTSIQFSLMGMMNFSYGAPCTFFAFIGSLIGTVTIHYILIVLKRESVLVIALAVVLVLSTIFLPLYSFVQTFYRTNLNLWDFTNPC